MGDHYARRLGILFGVLIIGAIVGLVLLLLNNNSRTTICIDVATHDRVPTAQCRSQAPSATPTYASWFVFGDVPAVGTVVSGGSPTPTTVFHFRGPVR